MKQIISKFIFRRKPVVLSYLAQLQLAILSTSYAKMTFLRIHIKFLLIFYLKVQLLANIIKIICYGKAHCSVVFCILIAVYVRYINVLRLFFCKYVWQLYLWAKIIKINFIKKLVALLFLFQVQVIMLSTNDKQNSVCKNTHKGLENFYL